MEEEKINKSELFKYSFYEENGKYIVVLNKDNIKKMFNADDVIWEETR